MVWWKRLGWAGVCGVALGVVNSGANVVGGPYSPHPLRSDGVWVLQLLAAVLGTTWAWSAAAFVCGWSARRWWEGSLLGVFGLWCADLAYYLTDWAGGVVSQFSVVEFEMWAAMGAGVGAVMGAMGSLARRGARWSSLSAGSTVAILSVLAGPSGADVVMAASMTTQRVLTVALALALGLRWGARPQWRRQDSLAGR